MTIQGVPDLGPGLRLHLNENTGGCSEKVVAAVRSFDGPRLATYPDFRDAVLETAAFLGVDPEHIVLTNGLDEGILLVSIAYLADRSIIPEVLVAQPAFEPYLHGAASLGARVVSVPPGTDFAFPLEGMLQAITPDTRLIYVNNPNNPSGQPIEKDAIHRIVKAAPHAVVFVDEAYHDFLGENFLQEARHYPNVLIGRTFSKAFGLAGMRVGVMIATPDVLAPIRRCMPLFNLNVVAVAALRAAIADPSFRTWYLAQAHESKALVYAACERAGLTCWKSAANFVLIDGGANVRHIVDGMIAKGVFVRDRTKDPSTPTCFRLTTGVVDHTRKAVEALEDVCGNLR
jgi:histidinol-phosphate aminotransferase